jgi:membrane-bound lytic murein transglycosylase D
MDDSAMRRAAAGVARDSLNSNLKYYRLDPKFEQQLGSMVDTEFSSLSAKKEDIPIELNQEVLININSFLNDRRGFMTRSLSRGQKYIPLMKAILRQKGLPENLVYLALIESGFRNDAISHANAVGPWQFIASTGRNYGLTIDEWVDERRDPVKATYAAADYLITLHDMFNSWPLAIAAYNSGEGKIQRGLQRPDVESYWDMIRQSGFLADETKRYVPSYLAAAIIARDPGAYGLEVDWSPPDTWDEVVVTAPLKLMTAAQLSDTTLERIQELNPHLRKLTTPPNLPDYVLRVPSGSRAAFYRNYARLPGGQRAGTISLHTASRGETLEAVARRYGADPDLVREFNSMTGNPRLTAGQELVIPVGVRSPESALAGVRVDSSPPPARTAQSRVTPSRLPPPAPERVRAPEPPAPAPAAVASAAAQPPRVAAASSRTPAPASRPRTSSSGQGQVIHSISHIVRQGDTLSGVAGLYGVDVERLRSDNRISGNTLYVGQILTVRSDLPLQAQARPSSSSTWVEVTPGETLFHTVQRGDTVGAIAERYRVTPAQLRELNNLSGNNIRPGQRLRVGTGPAAAAAPAAAPAAGLADYKVREGDTVSTVAERFGMKVADLRAANRLSGDVIRPGQTLKVRGAGGSSAQAAGGASSGVYEVKSGDTLSLIADRFKTTAADLKSLNKLTGDILRPGQKLRVRSSGGAAAPAGAPGTPVAREPAQAASAPATYVVKSGDTVSLLAQRYGMTAAELRRLNDLPGDSIRVGQKLRLRTADSASARPASAQAPAPAASGPPTAPRAQGAPSAPSSGSDPSGPATGTYEVRSGDTVSQIAERHGMTVAQLRQLNNLSDDNIRPGQKLRVTGGGSQAAPAAPAAPRAQAPPPPAAPAGSGSGAAQGSYEVRSGDTVSQIAERHGMTVAQLRQLNNLSGDNIRPGQKLKVTGSGASAPKAQASPEQPAAPAQAAPPARPAQAAPPARPAQAAPPAQPVQPRLAPGQIPLNAPPPPKPQPQTDQGSRSVSGSLSASGPEAGSGSSSGGSASGAGSGTYKVQAGDTLYSIAKKHGLSVDDLRRLNARTGDTVRQGETLKVK